MPKEGVRKRKLNFFYTYESLGKKMDRNKSIHRAFKILLKDGSSANGIIHLTY